MALKFCSKTCYTQFKSTLSIFLSQINIGRSQASFLQTFIAICIDPNCLSRVESSNDWRLMISCYLIFSYFSRLCSFTYASWDFVGTSQFPKSNVTLSPVIKATVSHPLSDLVKRFTFTVEKVLIKASHKLLCGRVAQGAPCPQHWASTGSLERLSDTNNSLDSNLSNSAVTTAKYHQLSWQLNLWNVRHRLMVVLFRRNAARWDPRRKSNLSSIGTTMGSNMYQAHWTYPLKYILLCCAVSNQRYHAKKSLQSIFVSPFAHGNGVMFLRLS